MTPFRRMALVSLNRAMVGVYAGELYVFAEVVATIPTEETFTTWNAWFDSYAVAWYTWSSSIQRTAGMAMGSRIRKERTFFQTRNTLSNLQHNPRSFMPENAVPFHNKRAY
jgi:hypothetical protein